jgi:ATP-binding cassette, subfamily F, member 3
LTAFENVEDLEATEQSILAELETEKDHTSGHYTNLLHRLDDVHTALHAADAHTAKPRAESVLAGLGFESETMERPMTSLSGGWRMRVALARMLLRSPDVLLLDEPTNHLDIDSIDWLESYLKSYSGTVVIVSHDRYVLDRLVTSTAELSNGRINDFAGNFSFYLTERVAQREIQQAAWVNQQKAIAEAERFIQRFRSKATKARQVQSRIKALEKLERIAPPDGDAAGISFRFPPPTRSGRSVVSFSTFSKVYDSPETPVTVFHNAEPLHIERGDKIALIGRNGAGKSTLARMIGGTEPFDGERRLGREVAITFFAQHTADSLDPADTVLEAVQRNASGQTETELRSILGAFLFSGEDAFKPVRVLSGGERSRVALAKTLVTPANFLILDEPTNHLDIRSIGVLIEAMKQYTGTFAVVSHDRHFLDQVATQIWRVEDGHVAVYPGTYSEYHWRMEQRSSGQTAAATAREPAKKTKKRAVASKKQPVADTGQGRGSKTAKAVGPGRYRKLNDYQLRQVHLRAEASIVRGEKEKAELETTLADPSIYEDQAVAAKATQAYNDILEKLEKLYADWESISEMVAARTV